MSEWGREGEGGRGGTEWGKGDREIAADGLLHRLQHTQKGQTVCDNVCVCMHS